ncbi:MAG TPA: PEGA domain-containing protein [Myxococcaceae bacterium]|nr:PEGA domain-containing protein [Myxococcaceae bacterium]
MSPLLIPMDQGAESRSLKFESYMNEALEEFPTVVLKKSDELFGLPPDEEGQKALERAEAGYREGRAAWEATQYEDAERKLRAALFEYQKAASALPDTQHYCETLAMYAAAMFLRGDSEEAKLTLLDLISLHPTFELQPKKYPKDFISLRAQVATSRNANLRGGLTVKSRPAGARIYLDGEFQGYTPATLSTLNVGKHLLRVERPGFKLYGEFVDVTPEDQEVNASLTPTSGYRAYDAMLDKIAAEVMRDKAGPALLGMGKSLALDRAIIGVVKEINENGASEMIVGLYDMRAGQRLSGKRIVFQGEEYGQIKGEVARLVNYLLVAADGGERTIKAADPLENKSGLEEWGSDDKGGRGAEKTKKPRVKDPLDGVSGTEDW